MKKVTFVFCTILAVIMMFSCSTNGTVWDDATPSEQSAKIAFFYYEPTSYNGIIVNKKDFKIVTLPAGNSVFTGDIAWSAYSGNTRYYFSSESAIFSCKLEGDKEYWAVADYKYDETQKKKIWGFLCLMTL